MKQLIILALGLVICLSMSSCRKELYRRPVTIDNLEFTNKAGEKYDAQFNRVNDWFLQKIEVLEKEKQTFKIDTKAKKRYHKYNHTLVASLDNLEIKNKPGVYYQLYLRPNSGIGKIKGDVQDDIYNELKLFSPESLFLQHEKQYYTDSIVVGPFNRLIAVTELYEPLNAEQPGIINLSIDSINFSKGFKKQQRDGLERLINNSVVLMQRNNPTKNLKKGPAFNYYPNYKTKANGPASYALNINVTQDPISNQIKVSINSPGYTPGELISTETTFNRLDFLAGHDYEANILLNMFVRSFIGNMYYDRIRQAN